MTDSTEQAEAPAPDPTKYITIDDPCPFCGERDSIDSNDDDAGPYGPDGQYLTYEKWACGACGKSWDAVFTFQRLEVRE